MLNLVLAGAIVLAVALAVTLGETRFSATDYAEALSHPASGPAPTAAEMQQIMQRFGTWMAELQAKDLVVGSNGLEETGKMLRGPRGARIVDGPYVETKEIIGGYIQIKARDLEHAVEIARGCPGLDYRLGVEVRPIKPRP